MPPTIRTTTLPPIRSQSADDAPKTLSTGPVIYPTRFYTLLASKLHTAPVSHRKIHMHIACHCLSRHGYNEALASLKLAWTLQLIRLRRGDTPLALGKVIHLLASGVRERGSLFILRQRRHLSRPQCLHVCFLALAWLSSTNSTNISTTFA